MDLHIMICVQGAGHACPPPQNHQSRDFLDALSDDAQQLISTGACLAQRLSVIFLAWQEDHKREDDFSRAMVATDDLACAHPAKRIWPPLHHTLANILFQIFYI